MGEAGFDKIFRLDKILGDKKFHRGEELAEQLGVHPRTVIRYAKVLGEGFEAPLESSKQGYRYTRKFSLVWDPLPSQNLVGLSLALSVLEQYKKNPLVDLIQERIRESLSRLDPEGSPSPFEISQYLTFFLGSHPAKDLEILDKLLEWAMMRKQLEMEYRAKGRRESKKRIVDPYGLTNRDGIWYLVAFDHEHKKFIPFNVFRIGKARPVGTFDRDPKFDLRTHFNSAFWIMKGEKPEPVQIRFKGEAVDLIQARQFHPTQKIQEQKDGSILFEVTVDGPEELLYFALDFGDKAEILSPAWLREKMAGIVKKMGQVYGVGP